MISKKMVKQKYIKKDKQTSDKIISRYTMLFLGLFIFACAYNLFILPNDIVAGGVSGIATMLASTIEPSQTIFVLSMFFLLLSFLFLGKESTKGSIIGSLLFPIFVWLTANLIIYIPIDNSDLLLNSIFGGILQGVGLGLVIKAGFTTGGTDILNHIIAKYGKTSVGTGMLITSSLIIFSGTFVFGFTKIMYAIIVLYILSMVMDKVILGISSSKAFYIVTEKDEQVKEYIINKIGRGVTILDGRGGYTNEKQKMLMCLIPTREYFKVKEVLQKIDKDAFFIVTDAYQSFGGL